MNFTRNQIIILGIAGIIVIIFVLLFTGVLPGLRQDVNTSKLPRVDLAVWGVFDDSSVFRNAISGYQTLHPNVHINYQLMNPVSYEQDLIDALAANRGPDILMFQNSWLPKHYNKLTPLAPSQLSLANFRNIYPEVVEQDFAPDGIIYALPLYVDTMALIYNRDFFDKKGVALPPKTWDEVSSIIPRLRDVNPNTGEIIRAAAAIGGSAKSINRQSDLLSALFLQEGAQMTDSQFSSATFADARGLSALNFYIHFANPISPDYTWNDNLHYSIDSFSDGSIGMIFNYAYQIPQLKRKNPFLNIGIAPMPQFDASNPVTVANYWGLAVSNQSKNPDYAWDFILGLAANPDGARTYAKASGHPPALRALINEALSDPNIGVFAKQALAARSWPQIDNNVVDQSFSDMTSLILTGQALPVNALKRAQDEISALMQKRQQ